MKKYIKYFIFFIVIFVISVTFVKAADLSDYFNVTNVKVCDNPNCSVVYDETNGIYSTTRFLVKFEWDIHTDNPIQSGDTVTIPFANEISTDTTTRFYYIGFTWSDVYDGNNNKIGQWKIDGDKNSRKMTLKFSDSAVGKNDLSGIFITTKQMYTAHTYIDKIIPLTVGNIKYMLKVKTYILDDPADRTSYYVSSSNNTASIIFNSPTITMKQLYKNNAIADNAKFNNLVLEVPISSGINATIENLDIRMQILYPKMIDLDNPNNVEAGNITFSQIITEEFTKINQNDDETYSEFKSRLTKYQYGIYEDVNTKTIIINFGSQPSSDKTYDYLIHKTSPEFSKFTDFLYASIPFTFDSNIKNIIENKIGMSNCIGGKVVFWGIKLGLEFPVVQIETKKSMGGTWSWQDPSGNNKNESLNFDFNLYPPSSIVNVRGTSKLLLRDYDSKNEIVGATIKLQKKNGYTFEDVATSVTDSSGMATFRNLESGTYRYTQTSYLPHYKSDSFKAYDDRDLNNQIITFNFDADSGNTIYASNERERFTIKYLPGSHGNFNETTFSNILYEEFTPEFEPVGEDGWIFKGWNPERELFVTGNATYTAVWKKMVKVTAKYLELGTNNPLLDEIVDTKENGEPYETEQKEIENYEFVRVDGNPSGTRGEEDIVVTYYYKKKESNLNIKYLDCSTNREIANSTNETLYYGDNYDADTYEANVTIPDNYNRSSASKSDNYRGVVDSDNINVEYCYNKKDSNLNTSMTMTGTNKITKSTDKVSYQINYSTVFTDYIGEATIKIVDTLPYKIDINNSNLDGGVYDDNTKTITWQVNTNINSYENSEYNVTKNIELKYKNINLLEDVIVNNVSGKTEIENKNKEVATLYNTYIDVKGTIVVKYLEQGTNNELEESITTKDKVGKEYEFVNKDIEGYRLVKKPEKEKEEYKEIEQEFKFLYERIKYKITVTSNEGGSVTGDEEVYYNEDSTLDNIKIKANENYYIKEIRINEKEIKIPEKSKELTIPQFKKMMEDKNIEVVFEKNKETVVVPNTLKKSTLIIFGIVTVLGSMGIMLYILYKKKIIFNK